VTIVGRASRFLKRRLHRLFHLNYRIVKAWRYPAYAWKQRHRVKPVIVYQMGKVGSSTVVSGLEKLGYDVYQVHVLTREWIGRVEAQYKKASKDHGRGILDEHLLASMYLRRRLDREPRLLGRKTPVITLVRDPVARNISSFFQAFEIYFSEESARFNREHARYEDRLGALIDLFLDRFEEHDTPLIWYDTHFKPVFGIDVYASPFPVDRGYEIYRGDDADALLIRLEDLRTSAAPAFRSFLGVDGFELHDVNIGADKRYSTAYGEFRKQIRLPAHYLDRMYGSRYARHFYSAQELEGFRARWAAV
jgi:hypothetical protein